MMQPCLIDLPAVSLLPAQMASTKNLTLVSDQPVEYR